MEGFRLVEEHGMLPRFTYHAEAQLDPVYRPFAALITRESNRRVARDLARLRRASVSGCLASAEPGDGLAYRVAEGGGGEAEPRCCLAPVHDERLVELVEHLG